jgi:hypothetical protein
MDPRPHTRLEDLRDQIALGTYQVDPQAVAAVIVARLQAGGVRDPEAALNAAIKEHSGASEGLTQDGERADRSRSRAGAQAQDMTPSAAETELVGPDSRGSLTGDD